MKRETMAKNNRSAVTLRWFGTLLYLLLTFIAIVLCPSGGGVVVHALWLGSLGMTLMGMGLGYKWQMAALAYCSAFLCVFWLAQAYEYGYLHMLFHSAFP